MDSTTPSGDGQRPAATNADVFGASEIDPHLLDAIASLYFTAPSNFSQPPDGFPTAAGVLEVRDIHMEGWELGFRWVEIGEWKFIECVISWQCPCCNATNGSFWAVLGNRFEFRKCRSCGRIIRVRPAIGEEHIHWYRATFHANEVFIRRRRGSR